MKTYHGIVEMILLKTTTDEGNALYAVKFASPEEWGLPPTRSGANPWVTVVRNPSLDRAVKAIPEDAETRLTVQGNPYRVVGTFEVEGRLSGMNRFYIERMTKVNPNWSYDADF